MIDSGCELSTGNRIDIVSTCINSGCVIGIVSHAPKHTPKPWEGLNDIRLLVERSGREEWQSGARTKAWQPRKRPAHSILNQTSKTDRLGFGWSGRSMAGQQVDGLVGRVTDRTAGGSGPVGGGSGTFGEPARFLHDPRILRH